MWNACASCVILKINYSRLAESEIYQGQSAAGGLILLLPECVELSPQAQT